MAREICGQFKGYLEGAETDEEIIRAAVHAQAIGNKEKIPL